MNNWILPETQKEIDAFRQGELVKKKKLKDGYLLNADLSPNYLILDAALWDIEMDTAFSLGNKYTSLFATRGAEHGLDSVAPYLFEYIENDELSKWIKEKERNGLRTLCISSEMSLEQLRKHLRRFLRMKKEDGTYIYFRFYDPFVANTVFPNLSQEQTVQFFEKIDYLIADDIRINERHIFYLSSDKILQIKHQSIDHVDNNR